MNKNIKTKGWVKTTPYGDYKDPEQNHKKASNNAAHYNAIRRAKKIGIKHAGSKTMKTLRMYL